MKVYTFDDAIKDALRDEIKSGSNPLLSASEAWKKIDGQLNQTKREKDYDHKPFYQRKIVYAASIAVLLFAFLAIPPSGGSAFSRLSEIFYVIEDSAVRIFVGSRENVDLPHGTPPPPPTDGTSFIPAGELADGYSIVEGSETKELRLTLAKAQEVTDFPIIIPKAIPEGYSLKDVSVFKNDINKSRDINLNYTNRDKELRIEENLVAEEFGSGAVYHDAKAEEIKINGNKGTLIIYDRGYIDLEWMNQSFYFKIAGQLTKEETIKLAESM